MIHLELHFINLKLVYSQLYFIDLSFEIENK